MSSFCVITTINRPTEAVTALAGLFKPCLVVVGDRKTPVDWELNGATFIAWRGRGVPPPPYLSWQHAADNHYARKNLGYLCAIAAGATTIYDTDDDNIPVNTWHFRDRRCRASSVRPPGRAVKPPKWCNVYELFHRSFMWPRGFPLDCLHAPVFTAKKPGWVDAPIQQGLSDQSPDVDAIWRLVVPKLNVTFRRELSLHLPPGVWCPFNSQVTWWWPKAYPLLYLPTRVSFRMTDIWRSFVAQRCLWEMGHGLVYHSPAEVVQERNPHVLLDDFKSEVPGYLKNGVIGEVLGNLNLRHNRGNACANLIACYEALVIEGILPEEELPTVRAWITDIKDLT